MEFQYLGTAAAEGIPALLCRCENCIRSRKIGGRAIRTRSQALIDGTLLIDFPADTYAHLLKNSLDLTHVQNCLITHTHEDHLYPKDLAMMRPGFAYPGEGYHLSFYGSDKVGTALAEEMQALAPSGYASFTEVRPFTPFTAGKYTVTAFPAIHDVNAGPLFYMISDGEKTVLYAHDTHYFADEVWAYLEREKPHFDLVSLDCTNAGNPVTYIGHMGLPENIRAREKMLSIGVADDTTTFVCNHFSHNGGHVVYDDFVLLAGKEGFLVSYDGMKITL